MVAISFFVGSNFLAQRTQQSFQIETYFTLKELDRMFFERSTDVEVLAQTLQGLTERSQYDRLEDILYTLRDYTKSYQNFAYIDENYIKRVDTNRIGIGEKVNWKLLAKAKQEPKVVFDFFDDPETKTQVISFVRQITSPSGKKSGFIVCNVPFTAVSRVARLSKEESLFKIKTRVELLRADGEILFSTYRKDQTDLKLAEIAKKHITPRKDFKFLEADHRLWSFGRGHNFYTLDSLNWFLVMSAKTLDVYEPLRAAIIILSVLMLLTGIIFWFVVSFVSGAIVRPIEGASIAVEQFGRGELKALQDIEIPSDDLGVLIGNLKKMGRQIQLLMTQRAQQARMSVLGEIAGNIAHEINNPLQVISIRLELLQKELAQGIDPAKALTHIDIASQTVFRISKIVKGLKALSREGDADPFVAVALQELIDSVLVLCQGTLRNKQVEMRQECAQPLFNVECRAVQITQVLLNLINNANDAVKDLKEEKWIELKVIIIGEAVEFRVRNGGPKISNELIQKIFDPFYTTKPAGEGTGLGLSISLKIAQEHSGALYVDTTDTKTCFVLKIASQISSLQKFSRNQV